MKRLQLKPHGTTCFAALWLLVLFGSAFFSPVRAQSVRVTWDASTSTNVTGYNIYYALSGAAPTKKTLGVVTSTSISGLQGGMTYTFYVTAVNSYGESDPSDPVTYRIKRPPVASNLSVSTTVGKALKITLTASDPDGDPLTYRVVTAPAHGTLSGTAPALTYTPASTYLGTDSFTFRANDGKVDSATATVSISVVNSSGDLTAPTVTLTYPTAGSTVAGVVPVTASASDNVGVTRIDFLVDGALKASTSASPAYFTWDTRTHSNGSAVVSVKAYDASGNVRTVSATVSVLNDPPPTVTITSPAAGSTVSELVKVTISASDNVGVTRIEFLVDDTLKASAAASSASFDWDTGTHANGTATVTAKAYDTGGNVASFRINVTIDNDTTPPTVKIVSPVSSSKVSGLIQVQVSASDNVGIVSVQCFANGVLLGNSTSALASFPWDTTQLANGAYTIKAQAYDAAGNSATVSASNVTVSN